MESICTEEKKRTKKERNNGGDQFLWPPSGNQDDRFFKFFGVCVCVFLGRFRRSDRLIAAAVIAEASDCFLCVLLHLSCRFSFRFFCFSKKKFVR